MSIVKEIGELNSDGEQSILEMLLDMYRNETPGKIEVLRRYVVSGDHIAAAECAHDLKSSSLSLGIEYCSTLLQGLNSSLKLVR